MRVLEFLSFSFKFSANQVQSWQIVFEFLEILDNILELFEFPIDVVGPVDILGFAGAVAVHYGLIHALVLRFHLFQVSEAPLSSNKLSHLLCAQ